MNYTVNLKLFLILGVLCVLYYLLDWKKFFLDKGWNYHLSQVYYVFHTKSGLAARLLDKGLVLKNVSDCRWVILIFLSCLFFLFFKLVLKAENQLKSSVFKSVSNTGAILEWINHTKLYDCWTLLTPRW